MSINYRNSPSSNENHNRIPTQHVHPEAMPSSQTLAGERRPGDPVHPMDVDPSRKSKRTLKIAAGATALSVVIGVGSWLALKGDSSEIKQLGTPNGESSAPVVPGQGFEQAPNDPAAEIYTNEETAPSPGLDELKNMGPASFAQVETPLRFDSLGDRIRTDRPVALGILVDNYTSNEETEILSRSTGNDVNNYTDQDILNNLTAGIAASSSQGTSTERVIQGQKMLSLVMSPDNPKFTDVVSGIDGKAIIRTVFEANDNYKYNPVVGTTFMGEEVEAGSELRLIRSRSLNSDDESLMVFEKVADSDGTPDYIYSTGYNLMDNPQLEYELGRFRQK